jgi:hypothetical protein
MGVSAAYPNPVFWNNEAVKFDLLTSCPQEVDWEVFTSGYRKIYGETIQVSGPKTAVWNLRDKKGRIVSNGLYFIRVLSGNAEPAILRILIQR